MKGINSHLYKQDGKLFVKICGCNHIPVTDEGMDSWKFDGIKFGYSRLEFVRRDNGRPEHCVKCNVVKWFVLPKRGK